MVKTRGKIKQMAYKSYFKEKLSYKDALDIFGIEAFKDQEELKTLYKNLSRKNHPDLGGDVEKMKQINQAYDVLKSVKNTYGSNEPESWEDRRNRDKEEQKKYYEIWLRIKSLFEKTFDEKKIVDYLQQFTSDPLFVDVTDNEKRTQNNVWFRGNYEATVKVHNLDNTTVFYVSYNISPENIKSNGLASNDLDIRDLVYTVSTTTNIYHDKRKFKITNKNYSWDVGFKAIEDLKNVFPSVKLKKIFSGKTKKTFKKADMLLAMKRELPGEISFGSGDNFWIYPFDEVKKFQIACNRNTMFKKFGGSPQYDIGTIFYPGGREYLAYIVYETEEDLKKLIDFVKTGYEIVNKKKLDPKVDGKEIARIFKTVGDKIFEKK